MPATPHKTPARHLVWPVVCVLLVVALVVASVVAVPAALAEVAPGSGASTGTGSGAVDGSGGTAAANPSVAGDSEEAPPVDADAVQRALDGVLDGAPGTAGAAVLAVDSDDVVAGESPERAVVPASNQKLVTALSLAEHLDPHERLRTTVVTGEDPGKLTLVAGGDTLLSPGDGDPEAVNGRAGLGTLARRTADALRERAPEAASNGVTVAVDTSLFTGADLNPDWDPEDIESGEITRVAPIALYSHRVPTADGADRGSQGSRPSDPAAAAAQAFADRLSEQLRGARVSVKGTAAAPQDAEELAAVESAPVHEQSAYMLAHSDNSLAETLARVAAVASGREGSVAGVQEMLPEALQEQGIATDGLAVKDASGMAAADRLTPLVLARTVRALVTEQRFAPYGRGLPVGGGAGTLAQRFDDSSEAAARGRTRAKTGTLLDVASLSGYVQCEDGNVLVYSLVLNGVKGKTDRARNTVDTAVAALTGAA